MVEFHQVSNRSRWQDPPTVWHEGEARLDKTGSGGRGCAGREVAEVLADGPKQLLRVISVPRRLRAQRIDRGIWRAPSPDMTHRVAIASGQRVFGHRDRSRRQTGEIIRLRNRWSMRICIFMRGSLLDTARLNDTAADME